MRKNTSALCFLFLLSGITAQTANGQYGSKTGNYKSKPFSGKKIAIGEKDRFEKMESGLEQGSINRSASSKTNNGGFSLSLYMGAGMNFFPAKFSQTVGGFYTKEEKFPQSVAFNAGINGLYLIQGTKERFGIGISVGFNNIKQEISEGSSGLVKVSDDYYYTETKSRVMSVSQKVITTDMYGVYVINPQGRWKFFSKAGVRIGGFLSSDNQVKEVSTIIQEGFKNGNQPFRTEQSGTKKNCVAQQFLGGTICGRRGSGW